MPQSLLFIPLLSILLMVGLNNSLFGLSLAHLGFTIPFCTWLLIGFFQSVPVEVEEAALVDGCNRLSALVRVVLPMSLPALAVVAFFSFTLSWNEFLYSTVFNTDPSVRTIPTGLSAFIIEDVFNWGPIMGSAIITVIPGTAWAAREQKLVYWHLPTFTKIADEVIRENFEEFRKSAGLSDSEAAFVKISGKDFIPQINAGLETGNLPDVVWLNESLIQLYRSQGRMMDVTDIVDDMKGFEGGIFETSLAAVTHGGKAWGVPYALNPWPMHARVDVLEKHGLDYPRTWEAFVETCKIVQDKPFYGFGLDLGLNTDASQNIMQILWCHGGFTADDNGTAAFNNAGNIAGFDFINSMYNDAGIIPRGVVGNSESSWNNKMYQAGQVAFVNNPTSIYAHLVSNDPELQAKTGLFSVPAGPAGAFNQIDTWSTGIFNTAPEPELAKGLVKAMMDPAKYNEVITKTNGRWVPVYPKLFEDPWWTSRPQYGEFSNIAKTGVPVSYKGQPSPGMGEVLSTNLVPEALQTVLVDGVPAADAVAKVADKIAAIFERANG